MPHLLHLLTSGDHPAVLSVIERQARQPDTTVTVVLLHGTSAPALPDGVTVRRVTEHGDLSYSQLLDLIFSADSVIAW